MGDESGFVPGDTRTKRVEPLTLLRLYYFSVRTPGKFSVVPLLSLISGHGNSSGDFVGLRSEKYIFHCGREFLTTLLFHFVTHTVRCGSRVVASHKSFVVGSIVYRSH